MSRELGLTETAVGEWVKRPKIDEGLGRPGAPTTREREELRRPRRENRRLQMEQDIPEMGSGRLGRRRMQMWYRLNYAEKALYFPTVLCRALKASPSGYYAWSGRPILRRAMDDEGLGGEIAAIHEESRRTYGSPRVHAELLARGKPVSLKRVARRMRQRGLQTGPK